MTYARPGLGRTMAVRCSLAVAILLTLFIPCRLVGQQAPNAKDVPMGQLAPLADITFLASGSLQRELELDASQTASIRQLRRDWSRESAAITREAISQPREARGKGVAKAKMNALREKYHFKLVDLLKPMQMKRLREVSAQVAASDLPRIRNRPDVSRALNITPMQDEALQQIDEDRAAETNKVRDELRSRGVRPRNPQFHEMMSEAEKKANKVYLPQALNVLTEDQRKQLQAMQGEPFDIGNMWQEILR